MASGQVDMDKQAGDRGDYYRTIAEAFLRRRGAPYFLSPRDLALIAEWEEKKIPLAAVLEGISGAFERRRGRADRGRILGLAFCARSVEMAWSQNRERRAGGRRSAASRAGKRERAKVEAERFLRSLPDDHPGLKVLYERGAGILGSERPDEGVLEELDEETDEILWASASPEEKERWRRTARREVAAWPCRDIEEITRSLFITASRTERKIPYLSLFYY
jgi:hypothetical protein